MTQKATPDRQQPSPTELRTIFGQNLRKLAEQHPSVAGLSRELRINRTQFNRYLSGESFPRPDVLYRICEYFNVDARILLEPVETITKAKTSILDHPAVEEFIGARATEVPEDLFPSGFYRFARTSFIESGMAIQGLLWVFRRDGHTFLKGMESRTAIEQLGLPVNRENREYRGVILAQEDGIATLMSRRNTLTCNFSYLNKLPTFQSHFWSGFATRLMPESVDSTRVSRVVFEHLGTERSEVMNAARKSGYVPFTELIPFYQKVINPDRPFR